VFAVVLFIDLLLYCSLFIVAVWPIAVVLLLCLAPFLMTWVLFDVCCCCCCLLIAVVCCVCCLFDDLLFICLLLYCCCVAVVFAVVFAVY
jgi:hypothetical protein